MTNKTLEERIKNIKHRYNRYDEDLIECIRIIDKLQEENKQLKEKLNQPSCCSVIKTGKYVSAAEWEVIGELGNQSKASEKLPEVGKRYKNLDNPNDKCDWLELKAVYLLNGDIILTFNRIFQDRVGGNIDFSLKYFIENFEEIEAQSQAE